MKTRLGTPSLQAAPVPPRNIASYLSLPGVNSNFASTPDSVANSITGDIDLRIKLAMTDWTPSASKMLISKLAGVGARSYDFFVDTIGRLNFRSSTDGTTINVQSVSAALGIADTTTKWVRATRNATTGEVKFYTSDDGVSWSLVTTVADVAGAMFNSTTSLVVGAQPTGVQPVLGSVYLARVYSGIDGTLAAEFDPSRALKYNSFVGSSTGELWTINKSGATPAVLL